MAEEDELQYDDEGEDDVEEMKRRLAEMENEAAALQELQESVAKEVLHATYPVLQRLFLSYRFQGYDMCFFYRSRFTHLAPILVRCRLQQERRLLRRWEGPSTGCRST